jgi:hypothetical protein
VSFYPKLLARIWKKFCACAAGWIEYCYTDVMSFHVKITFNDRPGHHLNLGIFKKRILLTPW